MSKFYEKIYEIAKLDHRSANFLAKNRMFPQSIYFYEQCYEKSLKAVIAHYRNRMSNHTDTQIQTEMRSKGHDVMLKTM